jgi:hypothetical protein
MKFNLSIILLCFFSNVYAQVDSATYQLLNAVVYRDRKTDSLFYTGKMDEGMFDRKFCPGKFTRNPEDYDNNFIRLTAREHRYIKRQWMLLKDNEWPTDLFANSWRIKMDSSLAYFLSQNRSRVVYLFSKPIFIRNNTVALVYNIRLCCGGIYGPYELVYYRREGDTWKKWVFVREGAY